MYHIVSTDYDLHEIVTKDKCQGVLTLCQQELLDTHYIFSGTRYIPRPRFIDTSKKLLGKSFGAAYSKAEH